MDVYVNAIREYAAKHNISYMCAKSHPAFKALWKAYKMPKKAPKKAPKMVSTNAVYDSRAILQDTDQIKYTNWEQFKKDYYKALEEERLNIALLNGNLKYSIGDLNYKLTIPQKKRLAKKRSVARENVLDTSL
jgi:hypothetical protein